VLEKRPLRRLLLQIFHERLEAILDRTVQDSGARGVVGLAMRSEVFVADRLDPLPFRRRSAEDLSREFQRLVDDGPRLRGYRDRDALPRFVLLGLRSGGRLDRRFQGTHRLPAARPRHPRGLVLTAGDRQHGLRLPGSHFARPDRLPQARPTPQLRAIFCAVLAAMPSRSRA